MYLDLNIEINLNKSYNILISISLKIHIQNLRELDFIKKGNLEILQ